MLFLFPRDVMNEIWEFIELVSEGFLTYCYFQFFCVFLPSKESYYSGHFHSVRFGVTNS